MIVQILLFACLAAAFTFFLRGLRHLRADAPNSHMAGGIFLVCSLFSLAFHLKVYSTTYTPDLLVSALSFIALGLIARLLPRQRGYALGLALGIVLGIAYWAKAVMFPASLLLLALTYASRWMSKRPIGPVLVAAIAFAAVTLPLVAIQSKSAGRATFGETGKLNFAWNVNGYQLHTGWRGKEPGSGTPIHPPRVISEDPVVLEFAEPGKGTFPLWYDPPLWHQGMQIRLSPPQIATALLRNVAVALPASLFWLFVTVPAVALGVSPAKTIRRFVIEYTPLWLWPVAIIAAYCMVAAETRYLVPLSVAFVTTVLSLTPLESRRVRTVMLWQLGLIAAGSLWMLYTTTIRASARPVFDSRWSYEQRVADWLREHGLRDHDALAAVGISPVLDSVLFAQPQRFQFVSWLKSPPLKEVVPQDWANTVDRWRKMNVAAVITKCGASEVALDPVASGKDPCTSTVPEWAGFERIPQTPHFVLLLRTRSGAARRPHDSPLLHWRDWETNENRARNNVDSEPALIFAAGLSRIADHFC